MAVRGTSGKCNRWFFKFNGNECSGPMTIEAVVYNHWPSGSPNLLHHRSLEGYCENILHGRVTVELWVGQCPSGHTVGDAYTRYQSISRIMIEEVSRAQSWLAPSSSPEGKSRIFAFSFIHHFRFHNILIFFIPPKNWSHSLSQVLFCPNNVQCYEVSFLPI